MTRTTPLPYGSTSPYHSSTFSSNIPANVQCLYVIIIITPQLSMIQPPIHMISNVYLMWTLVKMYYQCNL